MNSAAVNHSALENAAIMNAAGYYSNSRKEILTLLPPGVDKVLEVGCGAGDTLAMLKANGLCQWAGGIELFHDAAELARPKLDWLLQGDIEKLDIPLEDGTLDVILCLDVLEHLIDPWNAVKRLHNKLKPGGTLIVSVPNVRNFRVVLPLLFHGKWTYTDWGTLDRTHLRFFTKGTAQDLATCSGLVVDRIEMIGLIGKAKIANALSLGLMRDLFVYQYVLKAVRRD